MMKKIALLLAMALCCCGCSKAEEEEETTSLAPVYKALPLPDLYLEIPETFVTTSSRFYEEYYICEDASVIVTEDTEGAPYSSVQDYADKALVKYMDVATELTVTNNEVLSAGTTAVHTLEFTYSIPAEDGSLITKNCFVGFLTDSQSMYIITCKSDVATYQSYRDDFVSIVTSASFVEDPTP